MIWIWCFDISFRIDEEKTISILTDLGAIDSAFSWSQSTSKESVQDAYRKRKTEMMQYGILNEIKQNS
jgi:hypothetical protein